MADDTTNQTGSPLAGGLPPGTGKSTKKATDFDIPELVTQKYPHLVPLILETESMNDEEREYWFQILPIMTEDQVAKFQAILENEKEQLSKLDQEYQAEISKLNNKHISEWQALEKEEERKKRQAAEAKHEVQDDAAADALLSELDNL